MAVISNSTFNTLSRRVNVRLQQGVPIVDADWNEMDDIRKFEMQAFIKWFVGDGVPNGNDGFHISAITPAPPPPNDFMILSGVSGTPDGLANVGRILVSGVDVMIQADIRYTAQPLHVNQGAAADAEATRQGVPKIAALATPAADGTTAAYLDVWEHLVTPSEDPSLVLPGLGTESCARSRREWAVRTRTGGAAPAKGDPDFIAGHSYYLLATIARRQNDANILPSDVTDMREQRLLVPPETLIDDVFGVNAAAYRRGQGRPAVSLREVLNAILHGEIPGTQDRQVSPGPGNNILRRGWMFDRTNGLVALWTSDRIGGTNQILSARLDLANLTSGFSPAQQITTGAVHSDPSADILPNGDFLLAYSTATGPAADVFMRRAPLAGLSGAAEQPVANTANVAESLPTVLVSGNLAVIFFFRADPANPANSRWQFRRFRHTDNTFIDAGPIAIPPATPNPNADTVSTRFHAALDTKGNIWLAFHQPSNQSVGVMRLTPATGVIDNKGTLTVPALADTQVYVLPQDNGNVNVFFQGQNALMEAVFKGNAWGQPVAIANTGGVVGIGIDSFPAAVEEAGSDAVWMFWARGKVQAGGAPAQEDIFFMRRSPDASSPTATGTWGQPRQMTISNNDDTVPAVLITSNNAIFVAWSSDRTGNIQPFFKRLITSW